MVSFAKVSVEHAIEFSVGNQVLGLPGRWISEGSLRSLCGHAPLLLPLSTDVHLIFVCRRNPCLEITNTTSELTYHWVGLSLILSENAFEPSRQTCLHENQEHRTIYILH
jgi:hypothetical protein